MLSEVFSSCSKLGYSPVVVNMLLIVLASLGEEHGSRVLRLQELQHMGSVVVAPGLWSTGSTVVRHKPSCSSQTGDQTIVSCIGRQILYH